MYVGLDIGTSMIKAALFDERGREIAERGQRARQLHAPLGWSEIDGEATWRAVCAVIGRLMEGRDPRALRGMGLTGVMLGAWLVDGRGDVLRPPILWNDARTQSLVDGLVAETPDLIAQIYGESGSTMQLGCTLPILAWLRRHEPEILDRAKWALPAKDYIRFRLTGEIATDESEGAMAPGSARDRTYSASQAARLGVSGLTHLLAPVRRGETLGGRVTRAAAEATGLPEGLPVAIGTGDTSACALGAGCYRAEQAASVLGTTCLNGVLLDAPAFGPVQGLLFILPGGLWMRTMVNVAGTTVLDWALATLCRDLAADPAPYDTMGALAAAAPAHAGGLVFVPYLSASGVIAPRIEPRARAGFMGLAPQHDRATMLRAIYEGIAHAIRDCYAQIGRPPSDIRLCGGGARSAFWSQIIADATGTVVAVPEGSQFGAKGAALCAATAIGDFADIREASAATSILHRRHEPDPRAASRFDEAHLRYRIAADAAMGPLTAMAGPPPRDGAARKPDRSHPGTD
ncbi:xylulokinase [Palleronia aestuarii]|uniref:Xylulokinase n=1 Tax=Palleronia aestuarii TaxID=568105 RepID=A0A2W7MYI5_9RHOB|nr:FGGY-family carbohydrate kinase [Palleronia aestuarii]PZX12890.1 xylulokinase [Palleronia aestuarii]